MDKIKIPTPVEPTIESELKWLSHFKKVCITYWYPKIADLSPETYIIDSELTFKEQFHIAEGTFIDDAKNKVDNLIKEITKYSEKTGVPFFLRTGQTSAKHYWLKTCYVQDLKHLYNHIYEIMEFSMVADIPANIWVVRKFLELDYLFKAFNGMPIAREFRFFVEGGKITHIQPYWPELSIERPDDDNWKTYLRNLSFMNEKDCSLTYQLAMVVAERFKDDIGFSVDVCRTKEGKWYVTDMAPAAVSYKYDYKKEDK